LNIVAIVERSRMTSTKRPRKPSLRTAASDWMLLPHQTFPANYRELDGRNWLNGTSICASEPAARWHWFALQPPSPSGCASATGSSPKAPPDPSHGRP